MTDDLRTDLTKLADEHDAQTGPYARILHTTELRALLAAHPEQTPVRSGHDIACDADYLGASCICDEITPAPEVCGNCLGHGVETCAAHPAPTPGEDHLDAACAWSDFRKDYGVSGDDKVRRQEHRAFMAGWQSARGTIDTGGVQR